MRSKSLFQMLPLRLKIFSSINSPLIAFLLIGISAILACILAITSGRWVRVFLSAPKEEVVTRTSDDDTLWNKSSLEISRILSGNDVIFTSHGSGQDIAGDVTAEEATGGLWEVCLLYRCPGESSAICRRQCESVDDPVFKRRPKSHVTVALSAINAGSHRTLLIYVLSTAILFCGVSTTLFGIYPRDLLLVIGAFCNTAAGLLQLLGLFTYASAVMEGVRTASVEIARPIGYSYDLGSAYAVFAFMGTNMAAIMAVYFYRGTRAASGKQLEVATEACDDVDQVVA